MPILNKLKLAARNLSPLEEVCRHKAVSCSPPPACGVSDGEGLSVVRGLGALLLTARRQQECVHPGAGGREEMLVGVNGEGHSALLADVQDLWKQGHTLCMEVWGQAGGGTQDTPMLLLEKWEMVLASKRPSSPAPPTTSKLLLQAVRSYLHFSQIRSWQEVGGVDHTPCHIQLLYRVCCSGSGEGLSSPHYHNFPPLPLTQYSMLLVTVATLPRLPCVPEELITPPCLPRPRHDHGPIITPPCLPLPPHGPIIPSSEIPPGCSETSKLKSSSAYRTATGQSTDVACFHVAMGLRKEGFPFSPPLPSPLSPKLPTGLTSADDVIDALGRTVKELHVDSDIKHVDSDPKRVDSDPKHVDSDPKPKHVACSNGGGGAVPPAACSPAPFSRLHSSRDRGGAKRRSCAIACKRPASRLPPRRSNSAPVFIPSLCLLGTFEESVLNGRLEPLGKVEGFTAEVGASGSFCPQHVVLPVSAAFYNLHDNHGGTSPYLGQVDLSGVGKRGYQVPRKGTVQVTLFNPNHTVVKIYIVTYDFSAMPPLTQTFLRQKTLSRPTHPSGQGATPSTYLPALHYLIHLRFLCSKSNRVYLHRDIRLIFARCAPDTDPDRHGNVLLHTVTEAPSDPKYSPCAVPSKHS